MAGASLSVTLPKMMEELQETYEKELGDSVSPLGKILDLSEKIKKKRFGIPNRFYFRQAFITDSISSLLLSILFAVLISSRHLDSFCTDVLSLK